MFMGMTILLIKAHQDSCMKLTQTSVWTLWSIYLLRSALQDNKIHLQHLIWKQRLSNKLAFMLLFLIFHCLFCMGFKRNIWVTILKPAHLPRWGKGLSQRKTSHCLQPSHHRALSFCLPLKHSTWSCFPFPAFLMHYHQKAQLWKEYLSFPWLKKILRKICQMLSFTLLLLPVLAPIVKYVPSKRVRWHMLPGLPNSLEAPSPGVCIYF